MAIRSRISDFLGLRKSTVGLLYMVILVGMGERMAERFLPSMEEKFQKMNRLT